MALSADDFVEPKGELREDMFPSVDDLTATDGYVETWLSEAQGKTSDQEAQKHWVYYRAYTQVANRLYASPGTVSVDHKGSKVTTNQQRRRFKEKAREHRAAFEKLTEEEKSATRSRTVSSDTSWM